MVGEDFAALLAAAQRGSEQAFSVLWRDVNPALLRYLRVVAAEHAEDVAAETWVQVVRGLPRFTGDEVAWRAWLFTTARRRLLDQVRLRKRHPSEPLDEISPMDIPRTAAAEQVAMDNMATESAMALLSAAGAAGGGDLLPAVSPGWTPRRWRRYSAGLRSGSGGGASRLEEAGDAAGRCG